MCDAVCHARKYVVPSETEILLEPNISCMVNTAFIQDVVIPSTTSGTCPTMDVLQTLLRCLIELHVHSMSLDIVLLVHKYAILA